MKKRRSSREGNWPSYLLITTYHAVRFTRSLIDGDNKIQRLFMLVSTVNTKILIKHECARFAINAMNFLHCWSFSGKDH